MLGIKRLKFGEINYLNLFAQHCNVHIIGYLSKPISGDHRLTNAKRLRVKKRLIY